MARTLHLMKFLLVLLLLWPINVFSQEVIEPTPTLQQRLEVLIEREVDRNLDVRQQNRCTEIEGGKVICDNLDAQISMADGTKVIQELAIKQTWLLVIGTIISLVGMTLGIFSAIFLYRNFTKQREANSQTETLLEIARKEKEADLILKTIPSSINQYGWKIEFEIINTGPTLAEILGLNFTLKIIRGSNGIDKDIYFNKREVPDFIAGNGKDLGYLSTHYGTNDTEFNSDTVYEYSTTCIWKTVFGDQYERTITKEFMLKTQRRGPGSVPDTFGVDYHLRTRINA